MKVGVYNDEGEPLGFEYVYPGEEDPGDPYDFDEHDEGEDEPVSRSYTPMQEYEITLHVHVPAGEPEPFEWDWPGMCDMTDEDMQIVGQRFLQTYARDVEVS